MLTDSTTRSTDSPLRLEDRPVLQNVSRIGLVVGILMFIASVTYSSRDLWRLRNGGSAGSSEVATAWMPDECPIYNLALTNDSRNLIYRDYRGHLASIDLTSHEAQCRPTLLHAGRHCESIRVSPKRDRLAFSFRDGSLVVRDNDADHVERFIPRSSNLPINHMSFSLDGCLLAEATEDGTLTIHDLHSPGVRNRQFVLDRPDSVAIAFGASNELYISTHGSPERWELGQSSTESARSVKTFSQLGRARNLATSADGRFLLVGAFDGRLQCWNLAEDRMQWTVPTHAGVCRGLTLTPDGTYFGISRACNQFEFYEVETGTLVSVLETGSLFLTDIEFDADGKTCFAARGDGTICLRSWDDELPLGVIEPEPIVDR